MNRETKKIAVLAGDGIGPEIVAAGLEVLRAVESQLPFTLELVHGLVGGAAYEKYSEHFPRETEELCRKCDAIFFGAIGGPISESELPKWKNCERNSILAIRQAFSFHANFRPVAVLPELSLLSPLKEQIVGKGIDILVVRELLGDVYFGEHSTSLEAGLRKAKDVAEYAEEQIRKIARTAFEAAKKRRGMVHSVDKANVLDTSRLWRTVVREVHQDFPEVQLRDMLVDNCAMQLIVHPAQFDVILTANLFGDILSDAAAVLPGSLGLLASASFNSEGFALYEPPSGSAPDIAGKGVANPIGQIRCLALMLEYSFGCKEVATAIERSIQRALRMGYRTRDIQDSPENKILGTAEITKIIIEGLREAA